jgi:hypothetical protein
MRNAAPRRRISWSILDEVHDHGCESNAGPKDQSALSLGGEVFLPPVVVVHVCLLLRTGSK